jgi:hypothetical protein
VRKPLQKNEDHGLIRKWNTLEEAVELLRKAPPLYCTKLKSGGYRCREKWVVDTGLITVDAEGRPFGSRVYSPFSGRLLLEHTIEGLSIMYPGYWWDGCSFIVIDRKTNMRSGGLHDEHYHFCRTGDWDVDVMREPADTLFRAFYAVDGGWGWIGTIDYAGLRVGARGAATRQPEVESELLVFGKAA